MVDYGLRVVNQNNIVQIDSKYKNHIYHAHGTSFVQEELTEVDIPDIATSGIAFIKAESFLALAYGFVKSGDVYDKILIASDSTGYVDWIVYKEIDIVPSGEYGLNVYDSTGNVVFSSNESGYLNVVEDGLYSQTEETVRDADNNYFAIIGAGLNMNYVIAFDGINRTETYIRKITGMKKVDSNTLDFDLFVYSTEIKVTPDATGGGLFSGGYAKSSVPQRYIELKPPPGI